VGYFHDQGAKTGGTIGRVDGDMSAWLFDTIASY